MNQIIEYLSQTGVELAKNCFNGIIVFVVGWYLTKYATKFFVRAMDKTRVEKTVISFVASVINTALKVVVIFSALGALGFPTTSLYAIFGTAGAALALGFKDNLGNFVSGIIILFTKPFVVGDYIEIDSYAGTVKEIEIMYTLLSTIDNKIVVIPNSELTTNIIVNNSHETRRRVEMTFDIAYDEDVESVKNIIMDVIKRHPKAFTEPLPLVRVSGYKSSSVSILVRVWCDTDDYMDVKFDLLEQIKVAFDENHIVIPFDQLDVNIKH